ncbi:MAG: aromatic ring-hydroxylating dioxygenase subunit alpha [Acidiferrobacterales bacterium]|nr:aromatic ring-hydroxylating dioxygenase subunit alpha [Acidiferrobacterales bacterium]
MKLEPGFVSRQSPPLFEDAGNLRQKVRAAGMDPNYWYAVEQVRNVKPGTVIEVVFWKQSIALYRATDGSFHALENRCAHRQIKLSLGDVDGCNLVCPYHGWAYDPEGCRADIAVNTSKLKTGKPVVAKYPVRVRYGLIWLFPGESQLAEQTPMPEIPELEGSDRWTCVPLVFTWAAHHSMVIDNVSDFTHAHLHRKYRPFDDATLIGFETIGDDVHLSYDTQVGRGRFSRYFVDHKSINTNYMELCYQYPYQWSNTDDCIKHWLFVLPINERTTRVFFLFYFKSLKIPLLPMKFPRFAMYAVMNLSNQFLIAPLLAQDKYAVEAEQRAYEEHWDAPPIEFNPVVKAFQEVTVRKWQECLERQASMAVVND